MDKTFPPKVDFQVVFSHWAVLAFRLLSDMHTPHLGPWNAVSPKSWDFHPKCHGPIPSTTPILFGDRNHPIFLGNLKCWRFSFPEVGFFFSITSRSCPLHRLLLMACSQLSSKGLEISKLGLFWADGQRCFRKEIDEKLQWGQGLSRKKPKTKHVDPTRNLGGSASTRSEPRTKTLTTFHYTGWLPVVPGQAGGGSFHP